MKSVNGRLAVNPNIKNITRRKVKIVRPVRFIATIGLALAIITTGLILLTNPKLATQMNGSFNMQIDKGSFLNQETTDEGMFEKTTFTEEDAIKYYLNSNFPQINGDKYAEQYGWFATAEAIEDITDGAITTSHNYGPEETRKFYIEKSTVKAYNYNLNHPENIVLGEELEKTSGNQMNAA
jgi:hypothetical protein